MLGRFKVPPTLKKLRRDKQVRGSKLIQAGSESGVARLDSLKLS
jgi:hypothetical protein